MSLPRLLPAAALLAVLSAACGGSGEPSPIPTLPAVGLAGETALVFPLQRSLISGDAEREMVYALRARRGARNWVFPDDLRTTLARSPNLNVPADDLPVDIFFEAEVRRIGDPLYGMIRRAASVSGARVAIVPLSVSFRPETVDRPAAVEVFGAMVDVLTGRILWIGTEEGSASGADDPGGLARAMDAFATRFLPAG